MRSPWKVCRGRRQGPPQGQYISRDREVFIGMLPKYKDTTRQVRHLLPGLIHSTNNYGDKDLDVHIPDASQVGRPPLPPGSVSLDQGFRHHSALSVKPCGSTEKTQERASEHGDQQEGRPDLDRESTDRGNEQRLRHRGGSNERSRTPVLRVPEGDGGEG